MKDVFSNLSTEKRKKELKTDNKTFAELVDSFIEEERTINTVLKANSKKIAQASEVFFDVFTKGGRIFFIGAGINHFLNPQFYDAIVPQFIPFPRLVHQITGALEIICNITTPVDRTLLLTST